MKSTDLFEEFEKLLREKEFERLDDNERNLANQFTDSSSEYNVMRQIMIESNFLADDIGKCEAPVGGADQVWHLFEANRKSSKRISFLNRKVSVSWVGAMAAALIISWIIRFPDIADAADPAVLQMKKPALISHVTSDTVIKEVPVYIQSEPEIVVESSSISSQSGGMVYMQSVESVNEQKNQRQGTNANELGDLAKLTVILD